MELCLLARQIFDDISVHGGRVYIVGGCVRDEVMGLSQGHDIDVEVYCLTYQELFDILSHYGHVNTFGRSFAIMQLETLSGFDFALPRKETKVGQGHGDFEIDIDPFLPIEKAILRRDLTMNALMYDYHQDKIIDLCHGMEDIEKKVIRCVNPQTFQEDPLRVLRIAQFMSRFEMEVETQTFQLCQQMVQDHLLDYLSHERVYEEYCKILMSSHPSLGLEFLKDIGALPPYLQALSSTYQRPDYHPEGDVFKHTMLVVDIGALCKHKASDPLAFMWSCLLHDIGKPLVTTKEGHAPLHNEAGVKVFQDVDLLTSKKQRKYVSTMIMYHMHLMNMSRNRSSDIKYLRLLKKIDGVVPLDDLILISCCDKLGRGRVVYEQYHDFLAYIDDKKSRLGSKALKPLINGNDLLESGLTQGEPFKDILEEAYELQLQGWRKENILRSLKEKYE